MNTMNISKSRKYQLTIISSCYNSESYLDGFFNNIVQMDGFENFLLLIYLNSPTVLELNIANKYKNLFPENIIFEEVKREFVSHSTNRGYRKADTEYIVYADVDDRRLKDAYIRMIYTLDNNPDCDLTYGDYLYVNKPDVFEGTLFKTDDFDIDSFTHLPKIGPGHFFRRSLLDKVGYWDEQLKSSADFDFQIRAAFNVKFKKTNGNPITFYTYNTNGVSLSSGELSKIEGLAIALRYGIYSLVPNWINYLPEASLYNLMNLRKDNMWIPLNKIIPDIHEIQNFRMQRWKVARSALTKENIFKNRLRNKIFKQLNPTWITYL